MSLYDIAKQLKANGYDPRKDKVNNGNQHLPGGEYQVILTSVEARIADSKRESINYAFVSWFRLIQDHTRHYPRHCD